MSHIFTRVYKGKTYIAEPSKDGYLVSVRGGKGAGKAYASLSAAAKALTGTKGEVSGPAWWGANKGKPAKRAKPARKAAKRVNKQGAPVAAPADAPKDVKPAPTESERRAARIATLRDELAALLEAEAKDVMAGLELVKKLGRRTGT